MCETQLHRNRGEHAYITSQVFKFVEINLHKFNKADHSKHIYHTLEKMAANEN